MKNPLAPPPISATEGRIADGYQLCARCGKVMVEGEMALVVRRLCSWLIYTHEVGPSCRPKAVRGWLAARRADTIRELENQERVREGELYSPKLHCLIKPPCICLAKRPSVCSLDDRHIKAELALAEYQPSDEVPTNGTAVQDDQAHEEEVTGGSQQTTRNFVEDNLIAVIDENGLANYLQVLVEVLWSCRKRTYATLRPAPPIDPKPRAFVNPGAKRGVRTHLRLRLPKAPYDVLTRDLTDGRPVEFALYSKRKVLKIGGRWKDEFECWITPKPEPEALPFNSRTRPDLYEWVAVGCGRVDSSNPYGPVAILRLAAPAAKMRNENEVSRRKHNVEHSTPQEPIARRVVQRKASPLSQPQGVFPTDD
jgi:hypothetical protein